MHARNLSEGLEWHVDGRRSPTTEVVGIIEAACERAEQHPGPGTLTFHLSGIPDGQGWTRDLDLGVVTKWERAVRRLERLPMATIAVVADDCGGTALDVLLASDLRIAVQHARLQLPADGEATWPGMAAFRLVDQCGLAAVRSAVLFGTPISAAEARELRLIDVVTDDPDPALAEVTERLARFAGQELAIRRQLMFDASWTSFEDALGAHLAACDRALRRGHVQRER